MKELTTRKNQRLKGHNYSSTGRYFVTICIKNKHELLGKVVGDAPLRVPFLSEFPCVSQALSARHLETMEHTEAHPLHDILHVQLSEYGVFVDAQIQKICCVYPNVLIDNYVIMPNHIHMLIVIDGDTQKTHSADDNDMRNNNGTRGGASPTKAVIPQIVQSLKSMTTKRFGFNMWQRSYHDHIIRNEAEYHRVYQYINENPQKWIEDCYYMCL